ncbi:glycosyltransferase [Synechococcus sp. LTW-R]|uniref:glycosyltransferase n=1 Tax=Synechococcus sp. LTW-R TaxID=2751170 RepID=UPI001627CF3C|nr:glycosyltransferase [Synechococcus sp. LTW-R]QNG28905.1 glycosyltransferase [Synechococcus sp. LTW-R]
MKVKYIAEEQDHTTKEERLPIVMRSMKEKLVTVVIPTFRSNGRVIETADDVRKRLRELDIQNEVIVVEDCGRDNTWDALVNYAENERGFKAIQLRRNYGQHNAILCGIVNAKGDLIITMDDDGQHDPEEIEKLIVKLDEGWDVVYGTPLREAHSRRRTLASRLTKMALQLSANGSKTVNISAFRAIRAEICEPFKNYQSRSVNLDALLHWQTDRISAIKVNHRGRLHGDSTYSLRKLVKHTTNMVIGFSSLPLRAASYTGIAIAAGGICALLFVLSGWIANGSVVPGFAFLACLMCIFAGTQLVALGLIGEYISRIYGRSLNQPVFTVAKVVEGRND